jgi:peptidoglycan/LPS O-acetylase OafA/YrhL
MTAEKLSTHLRKRYELWKPGFYRRYLPNRPRLAAYSDASPLSIHAVNRRAEETKRIPQLDGLRGLAILMVFVNHAYRLQLLWSGVDLFFVLSGFLITGILLEQRSRHALRGYLISFYERRARRILPPYILILCVVSLLFGIRWMHHWYLFLFLMNTSKFFQIIRPYPLLLLWTLAVEEQFYLIWPMVVYRSSGRVLAWLAASLVLAAPCMRYIATVAIASHWQIYTSTIFRMDLLAAGALMSLLWRNQRKVIERFGIYGLVVAGVMAVPLIILSRYSWFRPGSDTAVSNVWLYEMTVVTYTGLLLWALSGRAVQLLRLGPLTHLGRISYTFYLIQTVALVLIRRHVHHYSVGNCCAFVAALLFSILSWHFMERPILEMGRPSVSAGSAA